MSRAVKDTRYGFPLGPYRFFAVPTFRNSYEKNAESIVFEEKFCYDTDEGW